VNVMVSEPLVSIILCVKDGMPYLPYAIESVANQSYRNFELIIQDGASNDGTLQYLESVTGIPRTSIASDRDNGIGDAYNRAIKRCNGALIGTIDADNLLTSDAIANAVRAFVAHPEAAAVYGDNDVFNENGRNILTFRAGSFDRTRLMLCDLVPPFASAFFSREVCGPDLYFDEGLKTCADFDLWLRLSHLPIYTTTELIARTRISPKSMTCKPDRYDQFCSDKITALQHFIRRHGEGLMTEATYKLCVAGVYFWAAESIAYLEGLTPQFVRYCAAAAQYDPSFERWKRLFFQSGTHSSNLDLSILFLTRDLKQNLRADGSIAFLTRLRIALNFVLHRYEKTAER